MPRSELQELIDNPNETLNFEYKEWLDLVDSNEARADMARHIAALSNYGGGVIVFGFTDKLQLAGANPYPKVIYDRDLIAGITKKYLEPTFQCDVFMIGSRAGSDHPVIVVPSHGLVPICAKSGGPLINGKSKGISQGVYYTRKAGPESAAILTAAEWAPVIRRCAMHERTAILGAIDAALRSSTTSTASKAETLKIWHDAAHAVFLRDIKKTNAPPRLSERHYQFSYAIERSDGQRIDQNNLETVLQQVNREVHDLVNTGWSMFYIFTRPAIEPFFNTDAASGQEEQDFLECALMHDTDPRQRNMDMWRVSVDGQATLIRDYREDDIELNQRLSRVSGSWFSPRRMVCSLAELVRHARGLSERFDMPTTVSFRCEWYGLAGRGLFDLPSSNWSDHRVGRSDHRVVTGVWPVGTLADGWVDIVARLSAPVARLFTIEKLITPEWIAAQEPKWRL